MARMSMTTDNRPRSGLRGPRLLGLVALLLLLPVSNMAQQVLDLCGCAGDPTLQPFNAANPATYPPGTTGCTSNCTSGTITFTTPPDGILKFSSFTADGGFNILLHAERGEHADHAARGRERPLAWRVRVLPKHRCQRSGGSRAAARPVSRGSEGSAATADSVVATARRSRSTARPSAEPASDPEAARAERPLRSRAEERSSASRSSSRCSGAQGEAGARASERR